MICCLGVLNKQAWLVVLNPVTWMSLELPDLLLLEGQCLDMFGSELAILGNLSAERLSGCLQSTSWNYLFGYPPWLVA